MKKIKHSPFRCVLSAVFLLLGSMFIHTTAACASIFASGKTRATLCAATGLSIVHKILPSVNNTYGYNILIDGKINIHQTSHLIIENIKKRQMLPTSYTGGSNQQNTILKSVKLYN